MDGPLRAHVLGSFEIEGVDIRTLRSRKARTVLKVLALARGQAVSVDRLVDALWSDDPPNQPERELAVNVSRARQLVGAERIDRDDAGYRLAVDWLDLVAVEEMSYRDVAEITGVPVGTVMSRLSRARGALRVLLGESGTGLRRVK